MDTSDSVDLSPRHQGIEPDRQPRLSTDLQQQFIAAPKEGVLDH